jgi:LppM domain
MTAVPMTPTAPRRRVLPLLLLVLLIATSLLSGCARVRAALAVQPDDTVTGEVVIATPEKSADDPGPTITVPSDLESDVDVTPYRQDGYAGSVLRFSGLTFAQVAGLATVAGPAGDAVRFELRRAGNRVLVNGAVDLTTVAVDRADFQLKVGFPGQVLETNGDDDTSDSSTVSWTFTPGEVGDTNAVVAFDDPNAPSALNWTILLGSMVALAAVAVVVVARRTRNPPVSPGR